MNPGSGRTPGRAWRALAVAAAVTAVVGCAKREPPSGGPPDIEVPRLVAADPDSGSAGVALSRSFMLTFSEPMEPRSTGQAVSIAPYVEIDRLRWKGRSLTIAFAESLQADRTYTLFVGGTARDRHNNPMGTGTTILFSTGSEFPAGRIEGTITARGFSGPGTQIWCYDATRTDVPDSTARDYDAIGFAGEGGVFRVDGLAAPGRYRLWAFADLNRNRSFEPETDVLAPADTVIELGASAPVASDIRVTMTNPRAPGRAIGGVRDALPDTAGIYRVIARSRADTTLFAVTTLEDDMAFDLQLAPGVWVLRAWVDVDANRAWQAATEPASEPFEVTIGPTVEVRDIELVIRRERGPRDGGTEEEER